MAQLIMTVNILLPSPIARSPEYRAVLTRERQIVALEMRAVMNEARRQARQLGPKRTGAMLRGARVRRLKAQYPGAVSYELRLSKFYSSFTNHSGRNRGWFVQLELAVERAALAVGTRSAIRIRDSFPGIIFGQLVRIALRSAAVTVRGQRGRRVRDNANVPNSPNGDF